MDESNRRASAWTEIYQNILISLNETEVIYAARSRKQESVSREETHRVLGRTPLKEKDGENQATPPSNQESHA